MSDIEQCMNKEKPETERARIQTHFLTSTFFLINTCCWVCSTFQTVYMCVCMCIYRYIYIFYAAAAKLLQSCPTLCDPIDSSPPGSAVPGVLQARTLEWVPISFSDAWKWKVKVNSLSCVPLLATPWTAAYQAPPSMGFSRQEYWSGVPLPSPGWSLQGHKESDMTEWLNNHHRTRSILSIKMCGAFRSLC